MTVNTGSYIKKTSFWQLNDAWRARYNEVNDQFLAQSSAAAETFGTAHLSLVNGLASLTGQIAVKRLQQDAINKALATVNKLV